VLKAITPKEKQAVLETSQEGGKGLEPQKRGGGAPERGEFERSKKSG